MRLFVYALAAMLALSAAAQAESSTANRVTYAKDIAPILHSHCADCHRPNQIAPMSLLTYDETRPWAKSIAQQVSQRAMPPWFASEDSLHFQNKNVLTDKEIALIARWAETGAPLGNRNDVPPAPTFNDEGWRIGTPDAIYTMDEPYVVADRIDDIQPDLTIDPKNSEDRWLAAVEIKPGNPELVHHVLAYIQSPSGQGSRGFGNGELVGLYAPGTPPIEFAEGYGKRFPAGAKIRLQMHYHKEAGPGTAATDQSSVGFKFAAGPVEHPVTTAWIAQLALNIPPHADNVRSTSQFTFKDDGHILGFMPHMHYRGKDMHYAAHYPDGEVETLLDVPNYDFSWQLAYLLPEPKPVPKGTVVRVVAHHDNSAGNRYNPDPTQHVRWGSETTDEMMIGFMDYAYVTLKDEQTMFPDGGGAFGGGRGRGGRGGGSNAGQLFDRFDDNSDGKLSKDEVPGAFQEIFTQLDKDSDGFVDREEIGAFRRD